MSPNGLQSLLPRSVPHLVLLFATGCGPARAPEKPLPETLVLRVDTVQVSATRANAAGPWDEPEGDSPDGRSASEPDLRLTLGAGATTKYSTFVFPDTSSQSLQYELAVPVSAIPADGLRLEVFDDDKEGSELIGSLRLTSAQLAKAYRSPSKLLVLSAGSIQRLELVVSAYAERPVSLTQHPAKAPPFLLNRPVKAGELISVRASGRFKVGSYYDDTLDPAGYPDGEAMSYNLGPFKREPHACAIALIGARPTLDGIAIGNSKDFIAPHAGPLRLGLNDKDLDNNEGTVSFEVSLRAPTAQEWLQGGQAK